MGNEEYQPPRKEVWKSIRNDFGNSFKKFGKGTLDFGKNFGGMVLYLNSMPYWIPTCVREIAESKEGSSFSRIENSAFWAGLFGAIYGIGGQIKLYIYLTNKTGLPLWAIPAAGTTISGLYEGGRWLNRKYQKTKKKLISENSKKNLEGTLKGGTQ